MDLAVPRINDDSGIGNTSLTDFSVREAHIFKFDQMTDGLDRPYYECRMCGRTMYLDRDKNIKKRGGFNVGDIGDRMARHYVRQHSLRPRKFRERPR